MKEPLVYPMKIYPIEYTMTQVRDAYEEDFDGLTPPYVYHTPAGWVAGNVDNIPWEEESEDDEE